MEKIYIDRHYDKQFLIKYGQDVRSIIIPKGTLSYNINSILLSYCPNVEEFIINGNMDFEFKNGVLYSKHRGDTREIEYITKDVGELFIEADVTGLSRWHDTKTVTVDKGNTVFTVSDNMLLGNKMQELYFVFSEAEKVRIPEGVKKIHYEAFADCKNLKEIAFPESYTWSEWYTPPKESLWIINDNVKHLKVEINGDRAGIVDGIIVGFPNSISPEPIIYLGNKECCHIPNTIKGTYKFEEAFNGVKSFTVDDDHPSFTVINGMVLDKSGNKLLFYPRPRMEAVIPESVDTIGCFAFANCNNLQKVIIPENVKVIEDNAFSHCASLKSVSFMNPCTKTASSAFAGCTLTEGEYKTGIEEGVYYNGKTVTGLSFTYNGDLKVREGTVSIKKIYGPGRPGVAEFGATEVNAEKLIIPQTVSEIGDLLVPLKNIEVDIDNPVFCSVDGVLFSKDMKTLIRYPERHAGGKYIVPECVKTIADFAFYNCINLKSVTLQDNVTNIGEKAFCRSKLDVIELPAHPLSIGELAITVNVYYKHGGKHKDANTIIKFRYQDLLIPLVLIDNWRLNKEEKLLAEFIETPSQSRKKGIYSDIKTTAYKRFMALLLAIVYDDADCMQYLLRSKKKIEEDGLYNDLFIKLHDYENADNSSELKSFMNKWYGKKETTKKAPVKRLKDEPVAKMAELAVGEIITLGHYKWGKKSEPIKWIVAKKTKNQYLLLSAYWLRTMMFYSEPTEDNQLIGWDKSDIREWLNNEFLKSSFDDEERKRICETTLANSNGVDTKDFIFIPGDKENKLIKKEKNISGGNGSMCFEHDNEQNQILGLGELTRDTFMKDSCCNVKVKVSFSKSIELDEIAFIRPMMWIIK